MILAYTRCRQRASELPNRPLCLALKDPLPGAEIRSAVGDGDNYLSAHVLVLQMRVRIPATSFRTGVLTSGAVAILIDRFVEGRLLQPILVVP
jgi:hypothetical protein